MQELKPCPVCGHHVCESDEKAWCWNRDCPLHRVMHPLEEWNQMHAWAIVDRLVQDVTRMSTHIGLLQTQADRLVSALDAACRERDALRKQIFEQDVYLGKIEE